MHTGVDPVTWAKNEPVRIDPAVLEWAGMIFEQVIGENAIAFDSLSVGGSEGGSSGDRLSGTP